MNNLEKWKMEIGKMNVQNVASRMKCDFCPVAEGCRVFKSGGSYKKTCFKRIAKWAVGETKPTISFDEWKSGITYSKTYNFKRAIEYAAGECPEKPKKLIYKEIDKFFKGLWDSTRKRKVAETHRETLWKKKCDNKILQYGESRKSETAKDGRRWWTPEEDEILLSMRLEEKPLSEIAKALGRESNTNSRNRYTSLRERISVLMKWESKWGDRKPLPKSIREMVNKLRVAAPSIADKNKKLGNRIIYGSSSVSRKSDRGNYRFWTPEEDMTLLKMRLAGAKISEIAKALGRGGNVDRTRPGRIIYNTVSNRMKTLFKWKETWGDRNPLPPEVQKMVDELKSSEAAISLKNKRNGLKESWKKRRAKK